MTQELIKQIEETAQVIEDACKRIDELKADNISLREAVLAEREAWIHTWVGLTDAEQSFVFDQVKQIVDSKPFWVRFADSIEAKLKEKNT
jgi:hypothetical protein